MTNVTGNLILNHVTVSGNDSLLIGGDAIRSTVNRSPVIRNSIFCADADDEISSDATGRTTTISYSLAEVGSGLDGVYVSTSSGSTFNPISRWATSLHLSHGWTVQDVMRTVGDITGNGTADLVGFGTDGVYVASE